MNNRTKGFVGSGWIDLTHLDDMPNTCHTKWLIQHDTNIDIIQNGKYDVGVGIRLEREKGSDKVFIKAKMGQCSLQTEVTVTELINGLNIN